MKTLLIFLLGLVTSVTATASSGTLSERQTAELNKSLVRFYAGFPDRNGDWGIFGEENYSGLPVVLFVLGHVTKHAPSASKLINRRSLNLIGWALELMHDEAAAEELPFVSPRIRQVLAQLMTIYQNDPEFAEALIPLLDKMNAWTPDHLPYLARQAGREAVGEATWFLERALQTGPWTGDQSAKLAEAVRGVMNVNQRTPEQWGLLGLSGVACEKEYAQILQVAAHGYAIDGEMGRVLGEAHPVRVVVENLLAAYKDDDPEAERIMYKANAMSDSEKDKVSSKAARDTFYEAFGNFVLLKPTQPPLVHLRRPPEPPATPPVERMIPQNQNVVQLCRYRLES